MTGRMDAQNALIGSILIDSRCLPVVLQQVRSEDLTGIHRLIFDTAARMAATTGSFQGIDPVTIMQNISHEDFSDREELRRFMAELMEITPTAANAGNYARIVRDEGRKAMIHETAREMLECKELPALRRMLHQASEAAMDRRSSVTTTMAEGLTAFYDRLDDGREWLRWPFPGFDDKIFARLGDYIVLGAESSVGKTAIALQLALYWAKQGKKVGFFSLETDDADIVDRMTAGLLGLDMQTILRNKLTDVHLAALAHIGSQVSALPLSIVNASGMTAADIATRTLTDGYDIILVDYLQLIEPDGGNTREREIGRISAALKNFGRQSKVTVFVLSQLNRAPGEEVPTLDRLRDSSQIRNDGDLIFLLYLKKPNAAEDSEDYGVRTLRIAKNKRGPLYHKNLKFDGPRQLFYPAGDKAPRLLFRLPTLEQMGFANEMR
ncbi:MAG: AAA family ATPase [Oscillospiraceae bacterium]|nr:AAA family ATPase [Oscillospiraceae bacterium]